jgi:multisite-specific tRNA:(cytosine-C5)-methyltransferase
MKGESKQKNPSNVIHSLTKAERKKMKFQQNKEWLTNYRSNGIEKKDLNSRFSSYYKLQLGSYWDENKVFTNEEHQPITAETDISLWESFLRILKQPLNVTFRITERLPSFLQQHLVNILQSKSNLRFISQDPNDTRTIEMNCQSVPWCPTAFELAVNNSVLLNEEPLKPLNDFLATQSSLGWVIRQELVSMIPVLLMDIHHSHSILDCCAAPGSKTEQIISKMKASYEKHRSTPTVALDGILVANDTDQKRIHELIHKFETFPFANILFSNMDGTKFSNYFEGGKNRGCEMFDRILCDVPCSGDGTFRKSPHLWRLFRLAST